MCLAMELVIPFFEARKTVGWKTAITGMMFSVKAASLWNRLLLRTIRREKSRLS